MFASFKSDFYLLRSYFKTYFIVFVFIIFMSFLQQSTYLSFFYATFLSIFFPLTLSSLNDQTGWEAVLLSAPVSRSNIVCGRYLMCLALSGAMILISFLSCTIIQPSIENILSALTSIILTMLLLSVLIPAVYKFGPHRARFIFMALGFIPAFFVFVTGVNDGESITMDMILLLERLFTSVEYLLIINLICVFIFFISYKISCAIYQKKQF